MPPDSHDDKIQDLKAFIWLMRIVSIVIVAGIATVIYLVYSLFAGGE